MLRVFPPLMRMSIFTNFSSCLSCLGLSCVNNWYEGSPIFPQPRSTVSWAIPLNLLMFTLYFVTIQNQYKAFISFIDYNILMFSLALNIKLLLSHTLSITISLNTTHFTHIKYSQRLRMDFLSSLNRLEEILVGWLVVISLNYNNL